MVFVARITVNVAYVKYDGSPLPRLCDSDWLGVCALALLGPGSGGGCPPIFSMDVPFPYDRYRGGASVRNQGGGELMDALVICERFLVELKSLQRRKPRRVWGGAR